MKRQVDRLNLKILKNDKIALMQIARSEGESMSVLVRKLIRQEIERKGHKKRKNKTPICN